MKYVMYKLALAGCGCRLDGGDVGGEEGGEGGGDAGGARGTATLRPQRALTLGRRTCYRLRLTNITPLPTAVHFDADSGNCTNYYTPHTATRQPHLLGSSSLLSSSF